MKYNKPIKKIHNEKYYLWLTIPLLSLALYIMHIVSGLFNSTGYAFIAYTPDYPLILFAEYLAVTLLLIPFIIKSKGNEMLSVYLLPLMLVSALGMMRIESSVLITSSEADHSPAFMFVILLVSLIIMALSGHTITGVAGIITGTAFFPVFSLAFAPFIAAASFLFSDSKKNEKKISVILNCIFCLAGIIYGISRLSTSEFSFSKKYIPILLIAGILAVFFILKKEYTFIPAAVLPLFPLASGIFFGAFPTPLFTLSASIAPLVLLMGTSVIMGENEKLKGHAQKLVHGPASYIVTAVFILHTAFPVFVNPGYFLDIYV